MKAYKGFNPDMTCRGFQYEEGKEYEMDPDDVSICERGFHACEYPLDVFDYYAPNCSVFREVEVDGKVDKESDDSKIAASKIKVGAKLDIAGLVKASIEYTSSRAKPEKEATGDYGASSAGNPTAIAVAWGKNSKAKGVKGAHLVLSEWVDGELKDVRLIEVDGVDIKENTFYTLKNGEIVEEEE